MGRVGVIGKVRGQISEDRGKEGGPVGGGSNLKGGERRGRGAEEGTRHEALVREKKEEDKGRTSWGRARTWRGESGG